MKMLVDMYEAHRSSKPVRKPLRRLVALINGGNAFSKRSKIFPAIRAPFLEMLG
jgi:hypothetical protein